jgi:Aspartyl protease
MSTASNEELTITIATTNGASESLPVGSITILSEVLEYAKALLGLSGDSLTLFKDGKPLNRDYSIAQAGVTHGDVLLVQPARQVTVEAQPPRGGLDFSSLLGAASAPTSTSDASAAPAAPGGLNFSNLLASAAPSNQPPAPVYYHNMNLEEAMQYNPHPQTFIELLFGNESLLKELNYYQPALAAKLQNTTIPQATTIWREECVKGGIRSAMRITEQRSEEHTMKRKLEVNPHDAEAKAYFLKQESKSLIEQQYFQMQQEFPESLGRVLMLYVSAKVNGHPIQAFVDSGAQSTIMSQAMAVECGIDHLIDTRFEGTAVGVGTGKILGRVHLVGMQIEGSFFPCTITVMENANMGFLLGLDMLKRHNGCIDLETAELRFKLGEGEYMRTKFLHEKDLSVSLGGTLGFDAELANKEVQIAREATNAKDDHDATMDEFED